jgi:hypothetical protein
MAAKDFKLDSDGDIYIDPDKGDFVITESDSQHVKDILLSVPGWWKEFPLVGWDPYSRLNSRNLQKGIQDLKTQLEGDGYEKILTEGLEVTVDGVTGNITAKRKNA